MLKPGSLGEEVLERICYLLYASVAAFSSPQQRRANYHSVESDEMLQERRKRSMLKELRRRKYIEVKKKGSQLFLGLTKKGETQLLITCLKSRRIMLSEGLYCIVSFDIPELERWARTAFRRILKELNFWMIHRSLWITRQDAAQHLQRFAEINNVQDWIVIFEGEKIECTVNGPVGPKAVQVKPQGGKSQMM